VPADSYEWVDAEHLRTTITVAVAECAQRLGTDLFAAGDFAGAESAARTGLRGAPDDFGLWDLGARAIDARADRTALGRWLLDASQHLGPADMERIRAGLTHQDPSDT
jgi:Flp pilus assembly protein TadD